MDDHIYLAHHGIKGQKWGVRRFQNKDGSLTDQGKRRYLSDETKGKIKKAAKVAAGVAGAAAIGYGVYKVGKASSRYGMVQDLRRKSREAAILGEDQFQRSRASADIMRSIRTQNMSSSVKNPTIRELTRIGNEAVERGYSYAKESDSLKYAADKLEKYGSRSDRLAYSFVKKVANRKYW